MKELKTSTEIATTNLPVLFGKKSKKISIIKPLTHIDNDTGKTRHYTPAAQEWFNSVYNYNPNYIKSLPVADINLMRLLKAYFSSELKEDLPNTKRLATRYRRHSTKKIFVGKGEIKHSNDKAIVTIYVHNAERLFLDRAICLLSRLLYNPARALTKYTHTNIYKKEKITYNRTLSFKEFWTIIAQPYYYQKWCTQIFVHKIDVINLYLSNINMQYNILTKMVKLNLITEEDKNQTFINLCDSMISILPDPQFKEIMPLFEKSYTIHLSNFKKQLLLNINKFRFGFINNLMELVEKLYDKKVEFNIVKLKKLHLNSDLFTQAVALKLKNRNNRLYKVLKSSLNKVNLPRIDRVTEIFHHINKDELLVNIIRNDNISSMFKDHSNDPLNTLLLDTFADVDNIKVKVLKRTSSPLKAKQRSISLQNYVFTILKHLKMRGIRIEAKGRITRRLTAARSVFKMKWKGGLKNIDSSFKGLSAILLRGQFKSNVQHTYIGTKNRNGAIGVKGWVSSK
jgi:hypothetical protein